MTEPEIKVIQNSDGYLVILDTHDSWITVFCESVPDLMVFLEKYRTMWAKLSHHTSTVEVMEELRTLLIDPDVGIFMDQVREVQKRQGEIRKRRRATGTP